MSPRSSPSSRGPYRKPRTDIYTWMLVISLVAIVIACICLFLEVKDYGSPPYQLGARGAVSPQSPVLLAEARRLPGPGPWTAPTGLLH